MDVCLHIPAGGDEVYLLSNVSAGAFVFPSEDVEPLNPSLFAGALSAASIHKDVLEKNYQFQETGRALFGALMKGRVLKAWRKQRQAWRDLVDTWQQNGRRGRQPVFRTYLCIEDRALAQIPWELLAEDSNLFSTEVTPWVRASELRLPERRDKYQYRIRILLIDGANPADTAIKAEAECRAVAAVLGRRHHEFEVEISRHPKSITALEEHIRAYEPHVLHFVGHSRMDGAKEPELAIWDGGGYLSWKRAEIEAFLPTIPVLRLSYLNACRTATHAQEDAAAARSMATAFLEQSLAVIGMHGDVRGPAAECCARNFYEALIAGESVDQAMSKARRALASDFQESREPYLPTLTVRTAAEDILALRPQPVGLRQEDFGQEVAQELAKLFVNHKSSRRELHGSLFGAGDREKHGILITGDDGTGKSWLIQWALYSLACRSVRVQYLRDPKENWLQIVRAIRDRGKTALTQGGCSDAEASHFNWKLRHLSNGAEPPPHAGDKKEQDENESLAQILVRQPSNELDRKVCDALRAGLEASAGEGLVLALDQWDLGSQGIDHPNFLPIHQHLLQPLVNNRQSAVRVILSVNGSVRPGDLPGWFEIKVPAFSKTEIGDLAEDLLRKMYGDQVNQSFIKLIRENPEDMPARDLLNFLKVSKFLAVKARV